MKIHSNIPKLQQGGAAPPFVSWSPIPSTPVDTSVAEAGSSKSSSGDDEGLLSKEMTKLLMENGLPSDVEVFTQSINSLYKNPVYRMTGKLNTGALSSQYLGMISNLSKIKFYKEQYDNSITRLTANGGLYDLAISSTGGMIVQDLESGQLKQVSPEEFYENYGSYKTVTNGDLAHLRATNPNMGFDSSIFSTLNNGIGQKEIQNYLDNVLNKLGSSTVSSDGYVSRKGQQLLDGISQISNNPQVKRALIQAYTTEDGVYKVSQEETSNIQQAEAALNYIYATLPENMKTYIRAKAASNGLDPDKGYKAVLTSLIDSKINNTNSFKVDYDSTLSKNAGLSTDSSGKTTPMNEAQILLGSLSSPTNLVDVEINTGGNISLVSPGVRSPRLKKLNQKDVWGSAGMLSVMQDSILSSGNANEMYFGKHKVTESELANIMYLPTSGVTASYIPITKDGSPDLGALKRIQDAKAEIERNGATGAVQEKDIYRKHNVEEYYELKSNPQKLVSEGKAKVFFMVDAQAANGSGVDFSDDGNNVFIGEINDDERTSILGLLNDRLNSALGNTGKNKIDYGDAGLFGWGDNDIYNGTFYIAAPDEMTAQFFLGDINVPSTDFDAVNMLQDSYANNLRRGIVSKE